MVENEGEGDVECTVVVLYYTVVHLSVNAKTGTIAGTESDLLACP